MSIQFFCGRPGSGKSYGVLENVILPALRLNRPIYTNIPLNLSAIAQDFPDYAAGLVQFNNAELNGDYLMTIPGGAVAVIDECWRWWPGGMKANELPALDKEFFAEHRHKVGEGGLTQEIVLISQTPAQIAKVLRDLIDQTVLTIKNNAAGSETTFNVAIYSGCIPSIDRPGEPINSGFGRYKPEIYKYYKSHTKSENGLPGVEIRADKRGSIWNHWYIKYLAPLCLVGGIVGAYNLAQFFGQKKPAPAINQALPLPSNDNSTMQPTPSVPRPKDSQNYRIVGTTYRAGFLHVIYTDQSQRFRFTTPENCNITENGPECTIDGQFVTRYTGPTPEKPQHQSSDLAALAP